MNPDNDTSSPAVVPLSSDMSNKADFVNSLFGAGVRSASGTAFGTAVTDGSLTWSFADSTSRGYILNAWLAA